MPDSRINSDVAGLDDSFCLSFIEGIGTTYLVALRDLVSGSKDLV